MKRPYLSERDQAAFGPRSLKLVGSPEWCWQTLSGLIADYKLIDERFDQVGTALDELTKAEAWEVIPSGKPYGSRNRMLAAELGVDTRTIQMEIRQARKRKLAGYGGERSTARGDKGRFVKSENSEPQDDNISLRSGYGTSRAYIIARLERDGFTELVTKVRAGEISANTAAIEAGFRRKPVRRCPQCGHEW